MRQLAKSTAIDSGDAMRAAEVRDAGGIEIDHLRGSGMTGGRMPMPASFPPELARHRTLKSFRERLGDATSWLACAIGNEHAERFYAKHGWLRAGSMINELETPDGIFRLEVWPRGPWERSETLLAKWLRSDPSGRA